MKIGSDILLLGAGAAAIFIITGRQNNMETMNTFISPINNQIGPIDNMVKYQYPTNIYHDTYHPTVALNSLNSDPISMQQEQTPFVNTVEGVLIISFIASLLASYVAYKQFEKR